MLKVHLPIPVLALVIAGLATLTTTTTVAAPPTIRQLKTDLLIVGATESGWAAAIQAARMGTESITIVHDGKWIGGQFTEQALACVDENKGVGKVGWGVDWHPMKRSFHRSGLFKELMDRIESFNTQKYGSPMPGRPYHGPSTFRPVEAEAVFREMLEPLIDRGQVKLFTDYYPIDADVDSAGGSPRLRGLTFAPLETGQAELHISAQLTIDASDWGDAIQLSGAASECGPDPKSRYNEPSAPDVLIDEQQSDDGSDDQIQSNEMNPITWAMILEQADGEVPIQRPDRFDDRNFVRTSRISLAAMPELAWDRPVRLGSIPHWPDRAAESPRQLSIYTVRRLVDGQTSRQNQTLILMNYMLGQDYPLERLPKHVVDALEATQRGASRKNIALMSRQQRQIIFDDARRHSLCLLYHLQNFVHERADDTTNSFRSFRLSDEFGTPDRLPPKPYIRESLRLKAMYMMREQDGRNADGETKQAARERMARVMYPDGVGCWQFHYDFHRTGRAYLKGEGNQGPWIDFEKPGRHTHHVSDRSVFPLRSLIPEQMNGLLGAQKNVGYSSIVGAAIRLHDQCIAIGQAAGATAVVSLRAKIDPRSIPYDRDSLEQVREGLCRKTSQGTALLLWPFRDLSPDQDAFVAINRLAAIGIVANDPYEVDFLPDQRATEKWQHRMIDLADEATSEDLSMDIQRELSRADFCQKLWKRVATMSLRPFSRIKLHDADADGISDSDDPTPFTPMKVVVWSVQPQIRDLGPHEDGISNRLSDMSKRFNFTPAGSANVEGFINDEGRPFSTESGHGWKQSIIQNSRRREIVPEDYRDTFLFTRDSANWECAVENGPWKVTVCVGDAGHPQDGQRVSIEGVPVVDDVSTFAGGFFEGTVTVEVKDGRLTMDLGRQSPGQNTCVNWIQIDR
jgi:hypothetical protein